MATGTRLTQPERDQIIHAGARQVPVAEIARQVNRSRSTIHKVLRSADAIVPARANAVVVNPGSRAIALSGVARAVKGRQSAGLMPSSAAMRTILPPTDETSGWTSFDLTGEQWRKMDIAETMRVLGRISPDIARAMWDFAILFDAGHELHAYVPGSDKEHTVGTEALEAFREQIERNHGGLKVQTVRALTAIMTRGMFIFELVLSRNGRTPIDLVVPDPAQFAFRRKEDPERGEVWVLGQWQAGKWKDLDIPTIGYAAWHPDPDSPYGKPVIGPAIFPTIFLIGLLHDLRRVVAQQGYPRQDIKILLEPLMARLREYAEDLSDEEFETKIAEIVTLISTHFGSLDPDDAWVHTDDVELTYASGAVDASVMDGAVGLIDVLERQAMRALKSMPLLMGDTEGAGESHSNREWEIWVKGLKSMQQLVENQLNRLFTLALEAQGIQADARIEFTEIRETEELKDEQTLALKIRNRAMMRDQGWITQDDAAMEVVEHNAVADAPPLGSVDASAEDEEGVVADPGSDRSRKAKRPLAHARRAVTVQVTEGSVDRARQAWEDVFAGTDYATLLDAEPEGEAT